MLVRSLVAALVLASLPLGAQSPLAVVNIGRSPEAGTSFRTAQQAAANNPWASWAVSGEASIKSLSGDGKFSEQWLLSASKITYEVPIDSATLWGMHLPIMANLAAVAAGLGNGTNTDSIDAGIKTLTSSTDGLNVGLYPYWPLRQLTRSIVPTLFLAASGKLNSFKDTTSKSDVTLLTGRLAAGVEFQVGDVASESKPLTLSATYVHSRFGADAYESVFKERRSSLNSAEFTLIMPLASNAGVIAEGVAIAGGKPSFRLGMMVAAAKQKDATADSTRPSSACDDTCSVQIVATENLGSGFVVTESTRSAKLVKQETCTPATRDDHCTFVVPKDKSAEFHVPDAFVIEGKCAESSPSTTCHVAAGVATTLSVHKKK